MEVLEIINNCAELLLVGYALSGAMKKNQNSRVLEIA